MQTLYELCPECSGTGVKVGFASCPGCEATGYVRHRPAAGGQSPPAAAGAPGVLFWVGGEDLKLLRHLHNLIAGMVRDHRLTAGTDVELKSLIGRIEAAAATPSGPGKARPEMPADVNKQVTIAVFHGPLSPREREALDFATMVVRSVPAAAPSPEWAVAKDGFGDTEHRLSDDGLLMRIYEHVQHLQGWMAGETKPDGTR